MIYDRTNVGSDDVRDFVRRLVKGGFAERVGTVPNRQGNSGSPCTAYQLLKRPLMAPRLDRSGKELGEPQRETLWRAMKMVKTFDAKELSELTETVPHQFAYQYLLALYRAGIVAPIDGTTRLRSRRFRLVKNLGARAPVVTKVDQLVFDPNSGTVVGEGQMLEVSR
jgi:hypothetical protein